MKSSLRWVSGGAEFLEDPCSVEYRWEEPVQVLIIDPLGEEGDNFQELPSVRIKVFEQRGCKREFDHHRVGFLYPVCSTPVRRPSNSLVLVCNHSEQGDW